jgi:PAS domain S-box-containing protein
MPQIVWVTRPDGGYIYFNQRWVDYTGLTLEESYGHGWNTPFHIDDQKRAWDAWQNAVNNHDTYSLECRLRRADGEYRWWLIRGVPALDDAGKAYKWYGTCTDIHEIKQAEAALLKAQEQLENRVIKRTEQLRQLAVQATLAEERERKAIARDLHDDLGQILHVAKVKFDGLTKTLSSELHPQISELNTLIADASRLVRSLTSQLSPPILRDLGLGLALHWLSNEMMRNYNLVVETRIEDMQITLTPAETIILFRAARELLINVAKHAESVTAAVELYCRDGYLLLAVEDEGIGIDNLELALNNHKGYGLSSVRERIIFLGGTLELNSKKGGGIRAVLKMPLYPIADNCKERVK